MKYNYFVVASDKAGRLYKRAIRALNEVSAVASFRKVYKGMRFASIDAKYLGVA